MLARLHTFIVFILLLLIHYTSALRFHDLHNSNPNDKSYEVTISLIVTNKLDGFSINDERINPKGTQYRSDDFQYSKFSIKAFAGDKLGFNLAAMGKHAGSFLAAITYLNSNGHRVTQTTNIDNFRCNDKVPIEVVSLIKDNLGLGFKGLDAKPIWSEGGTDKKTNCFCYLGMTINQDGEEQTQFINRDSE
jgi:hypothetical protein